MTGAVTVLHLSNDLPGSYLFLRQGGRSEKEMINHGVSRQSWRDGSCAACAHISRQHLLHIQERSV